MARLVGTPECEILTSTGKKLRYLNSTMGFYKDRPELALNIPGFNGCKNGGTAVAKFCMASSVVDPDTGSWIVGAILGSSSKLERTRDTQRLHKWVKSLLATEAKEH